MKRFMISLSALLLLLALMVPTGFAAAAGPGSNPSVLPSQDDEEGEGEGEDGEAEEQEVTSPSQLNQVVVATTNISMGTRLTEDILMTELRPADNIAVRGGWVVGDIEDLVGKIVKTDIAAGQAILSPMIAINSTDLDQIGSDLSLFVSNGRVAIAFPMNQYSGVGYAMRPGDFVDVLMSFNLVELDLEFQTPLPNITQLVDSDSLEAGFPFLLPAISQGRLEFVEVIGQTAQITPGDIVPDELSSQADTLVRQEPRRVTQLAVQQAEVLWVGDWQRPNLPGWQGPNNYELAETFAELDNAQNELSPEERQEIAESFGIIVNNLDGLDSLTETRTTFIGPDVVILSLPLQDALVLKWALEEPGIHIDLALRAQGDNALFVTTSVSLPQLVDQAGLAIPEPSQFGLEPGEGDLSTQFRLPPFREYDLGAIQSEP